MAEGTGRAGVGGPDRTRRRRTVRRLLRTAVLVVLVVGLYGFLPRVGGLAEQAAVLERADPRLVVAAVLSEATAVALYVVAYRRVLGEMGARRSLAVAFDAMMAAFFVSHVAVMGTAAGLVVNVEALRDADVDTETSTESIAVLSLLTAGGVVGLLTVGLGLSAGTQTLAGPYRVGMVVAVVAVGGGLLLAGLVARYPDAAGRVAARLAARVAPRRLRLAPRAVAAVVRRLSDRIRTVLVARRLAVTAVPVAGQLLLDVTALYLFLAAVGHPPAVGQLLVAYGVATVLGSLPLTPSGLGVVEATLIAFAIGFGTPSAAAIPAVLGYRLVNYWLPLPVGAVAYARVTLRRRRAHSRPSTAATA